MATPSQRQIEANRANAQKSTGPKTAEGKERSRRNGLSHGLAAELLVPDEDRIAYEVAMARWEREAGPDNVVERHLVQRAAVASVRLGRIEKAREQTREATARQAVGRWEKSGQARARKTAQGLASDPANTLNDLEATAFGCEWLIRQWNALHAPLSLGRSWDQRTLGKAQLLLGLPEGTPGPEADRLARKLWILAAAAQPDRVTCLPRHPSEESLPTDPVQARGGLHRLIVEQIVRLERLRDESWEAVEGPERQAVALRAAAADTSKQGQLMHRYEAAADRSCFAAIRQFLNLRDRRRRWLLEISREARQCDTPRAPVGGGWWREPDSDPAPPGFERIAVLPDLDLDLDPTAEAAPQGDPGPAPSPTPSEAPSAAGAPERSEPISPDGSAGNLLRKSMRDMKLRGDVPGGPADPDRRTDPAPPLANPRLDEGCAPNSPPSPAPDRPRSPLPGEDW